MARRLHMGTGMRWMDLVAHMRESYRLDEVNGSRIDLTWRLGSTDTPIQQAQTVTHVKALDREWIAIASVVADESRWQSRAAVAHNSRLAIGALALVDGAFVVRHVLPLATLDDETLDEVLAVVADEASVLAASVCTLADATPHAFWVE